MNKVAAPRRKPAFTGRDPVGGTVSANAAATLLAAAGDVAVILAQDGTVLDLCITEGDLENHGFTDWIGDNWADTVAVDSRAKVEQMLAEASSGSPQGLRWREVNQVVAGGDIPLRYLVAPLGDEGRLIAIGRDMRSIAAMQQRLLKTQQSLERDYIRLRQAETRYRLLFDIAAEPVLIVDAQTRVIREANPAAHRLLGLAEGALVGNPVNSIVEEGVRDDLIAHLGAAEAASDPAPISLPLREHRGEARISARLFREVRQSLMLVRIIPASATIVPDQHQDAVNTIVERMPDAFVLVDRDLVVLTANAAFVELAEMATDDRVVGARLSNWLGRPGVDLELIIGQLRDHGMVRNLATIMRGAAGGREEVEVSAVAAPMKSGECYGFTIRNVGRRLRSVPADPRDMPRSVEQLTELVGRMSLKEIVRESTDLIERLCIESALAYTSGNRAAASEILGVSRQSLYSKLHRHGLGNQFSGEE